MSKAKKEAPKKEPSEIDKYIKRKSDEQESLDMRQNNILFSELDYQDAMKPLVNETFKKKYTRGTKQEESQTVIDRFLRQKTIDASRAFLELEEFTFDSYCLYMSSQKDQKESCIFTISSQSTNHANGTNGFFDTRLGPLKMNVPCSTCFRKYRGCDGHRAWIEFPERIPNPLVEKDYFNTAKCICWCCEKPLADEEFIKITGLDKYSGEKFREELAKYSDKLKGLHKHGGYNHENFEKMVENRLCYTKRETDGKLVSYVKHIDIVYKVFSNLTRDDLNILRFTGETIPENYFMEGMIVVPPKLRRPGIVNGVATDHHLTSKYIDIFKHTKQIENMKNKIKETERRKEMAGIYQDVKEIFMKNKKTFKGNDKAIMELLSNKMGKIRRHGMGKRPDGSSRTVVGPGFECDVDEFGIPESSCKKLLVPIKVHRYNLDIVKKQFSEGIFKQSTIIINGSEVTTRIDNKPDFIPMYGNTLWRELKDGDSILSGRQPTLHGPSIMGFRAKKHKSLTGRLPAPCTAPTNCDFDGDEMSFHIVFTTDAKIELATCSSVVTHIAGVESNKPSMAPAFHALLSGYLCTEKWVYPSETKIEKKENEQEIDYIKRVRSAMVEMSDFGHEITIPERRFAEILCCIKHSHRTKTYIKRCQMNGVNYLTGRALLSLSFPTNFNYSSGGLKIVDGILVSGVLKSSNLKGNGSLVQVIYKQFSCDEAARFISDFTKLSDWLIMYARFSIGQQSFSTNREEIKRTLEPQLNRIQTEYYLLGPEPKNSFDLFHWKKKVHNIVDQLLIFAKNVGNSYFLPNNGLNMLSGNGSGGKGSEMNTSQITAFLGLQKIKGDIQKKEFNDGERLLPTFIRGDCSLESIAFITNSFFDGLTPSEQFAHSCSSREGLIDTAVKVSEIGYIGRRIRKSEENNIIDYSGAISSALGKIYCFSTSGIAPAMSVFVDNPRTGKILWFCDFKDMANHVNGLYEYIDKYMPDIDPDGEEEETEVEEIEEYYSNKENPMNYYDDIQYEVDDDAYDGNDDEDD